MLLIYDLQLKLKGMHGCIPQYNYCVRQRQRPAKIVKTIDNRAVFLDFLPDFGDSLPKKLTQNAH
jgi:hypothetical protein